MPVICTQTGRPERGRIPHLPGRVTNTPTERVSSGGTPIPKFPADDPNKEDAVWARTIPVPQTLTKQLALFVESERANYLHNYRRMMELGRAKQGSTMDTESYAVSGRDSGSLDVREAETGRIKHVLKYKTVDKKVRPVPGITPESTKVTRRFPSDPLRNLPKLPESPKEFVPTAKFTQERMNKLGIDANHHIRPEEQKLLKHVLAINERSIAFDESERGTFRQDYFSDYKIPINEHEPWMEKNIPIPPGFRDQILQMLREKIDAGVYEPTQSSYRSKWFCVKKKTGDLRIVHDLQKLNSVTIRDTGVPPFLDEFVEGFAGKCIYSVLDMYWGFYARIIDPESRDLTTFQTPLGALRIVSLPMGFTNSPAEFQACMMFILQDEICSGTAGVFIDDIPVKGPESEYLNEHNEPETLAENPGIRRCIWEHLNDLHRVLWRIGEAGGTISGKKMQLCKPEVDILGQKCSRHGRHPSEGTATKVTDWPIPRNLTELRGFLGLCGTVRNWIKDFSMIARPMVDLTRKAAEFVWGPNQARAFKELKRLVTEAPAIRPIDYRSKRPVYLSVDSSIYGIGFVLSQEDEKGRRVPARYGSLPLSDAESRYSQSKLELYGLFRALRHYRLYLAGVANLVVEVDAASIQGMLNHPDLYPSAPMNRWVQGILTFDFKLVHVPGTKHKAPDALSRRRFTPEENVPAVDPDGWVDDIALMVTVARSNQARKETELPEEPVRPEDRELEAVLRYLVKLKAPKDRDPRKLRAFVQKANKFFVSDAAMYRRCIDGPPQKVIFNVQRRQQVVEEIHEETGHRGQWAVWMAVRLRFYWPRMREDVQYIVSSCHECQKRSTAKMHLPVTVSQPAALFEKVYVDVMKMPPAHGMNWIVLCRDDTSGVTEGRALPNDTSKHLAAFFREQILYRYGAIRVVITDNGPSLQGAFEKLAKEFNVRQVTISPYNPQANGVVERAHFTIREGLMRLCKGNPGLWPRYLQAAIFADRITTRRATGYSPFYLMHGTHPLLPCDLADATFLAPEFRSGMTDGELLAARMKQLAKMPQDLIRARNILAKSRFRSKEAYEKKFARRLRRTKYHAGDLVLIRDVAPEKGVSVHRKTRYRYMGPYEVARETQGGSYELKELNGVPLARAIAAYRLIPYVARQQLNQWYRIMAKKKFIQEQIGRGRQTSNAEGSISSRSGSD